MSRENVDVVRAAFEAWRAGRLDALSELQDPDIVVRPPKGWPEPGPYVGRDAALRHFEQNREAFDANALEVISEFVAGDLVVVRFIWRAAGRGPEANLEMTGVHTMREGRVLGIEYFWDHSEALGSMGLRGGYRRVRVAPTRHIERRAQVSSGMRRYR